MVLEFQAEVMSVICYNRHVRGRSYRLEIDMIKRSIIYTCLGLFLLSQGALASSPDYHLKRLEIQAQAFLTSLGLQNRSAPILEKSTETELTESDVALNRHLRQTAQSSSWAENMLLEDMENLITTSETLREDLRGTDSDGLLKAKVELESAARRLRISTSPLKLTSQQETNLELMMLEINEASVALVEAREQLIARQDARRRNANRISVGVGLGSPYGVWGPWGYSRWGSPYIGGGYLRPYPRRVYHRPMHPPIRRPIRR